MVVYGSFNYVLVLSVFILHSVYSHLSSSPKLQEIRRRWGAEDIVRDLDHIKRDTKMMAKMQDSGEIKTSEALFYFLRMHDFDDNSKLDGHELLAAIAHTMDQTEEGRSLLLDEKINVVDTFFTYDDNTDGFISYMELRKHLAPNETDPEVPLDSGATS